MTMDFNPGTPRTDGRYLCIVDNDLQPGWILPVILTWRGQWLLPTSEKPHKWPVYGWIGPVPVCKVVDFERLEESPAQDYDL